MNTEVYVNAQSAFSQPELVTPEMGNLEQNTADTPAPSKPAVIRPIRHLSDGKSSVRVDAKQASPVKQPHLRVDQLDDYVRWLHQQLLDRQPQPATDETDSNDSTDAPSEPQSSADSQKVQTKSSGPVSGPLEFSSVNLKRVDHAEATVREPHIAAYQFEGSADLQRIEAKLSGHAATQPNDVAPSVNVSSASAEIDQRAKSEDEMIDELKARIDALLAEANLQTSQPVVEAGSPSSPEDESSRQDLIESVSGAIAAVLTDQSDQQIQSKIRQRMNLQSMEQLPTQIVSETIHQTVQSFEDIAAEAPPEVAFAHSSDEMAESIDATPDAIVEPEGATPMTTNEFVEDDAASETDESQTEQVANVPVDIAAWDVEEFRWPAVTNHMIATGTQAISQLSDSVNQLLGQNGKRLVVTGVERGEGATSLAISLARWATATGKQVLLIDADLASPGLTTQIGLASDISWIESIAGIIGPSEVIIRSQKSEVCVMPLAPIATRVAWPRFIYDLLGDLVSQVEPHFDLIILDAGPATQLMAELSSPELLADAALVVHNASNTTSFMKTTDQLQAFGVSNYVVAQNSIKKVSAVA